MASSKEDGVVGVEETLSWLPSDVLADEAIRDTQGYFKHQQHHQYRNLHKLPLQMQPVLHSKPSPRNTSGRKYSTNCASGAAGMQAFFLDSGKKSCGTGVFLPRRGATDLQYNKKPAYAPVLLPARVVQALNLNVNQLGLQISRRRDTKNNSDGECCDSVKNKSVKDMPRIENSSPETFLPKEWTY